MTPNERLEKAYCQQGPPKDIFGRKVHSDRLRFDKKPIRGPQDEHPRNPPLDPADLKPLMCRNIQLPVCDEGRNIVNEETLRQKILNAAGLTECGRCFGSGEIYENLCDYISAGKEKIQCHDCFGSGINPDPTCPF